MRPKTVFYLIYVKMTSNSQCSRNLLLNVTIGVHTMPTREIYARIGLGQRCVESIV